MGATYMLQTAQCTSLATKGVLLRSMPCILPRDAAVTVMFLPITSSAQEHHGARQT